MQAMRRELKYPHICAGLGKAPCNFITNSTSTASNHNCSPVKSERLENTVLNWWVGCPD